MKKHPSAFKLCGELAEKVKTVTDTPLTLYDGMTLCHKWIPYTVFNFNIAEWDSHLAVETSVFRPVQALQRSEAESGSSASWVGGSMTSFCVCVCVCVCVGGGSITL